MNPSAKDIRSVTELKQNPQDILDHLHASGRPVFLTVNGKADTVMLEIETYEKLLQGSNMSALLTQAEADIESGNTRPLRKFMEEFKLGKNISS